jgi:hypothetical protein
MNQNELSLERRHLGVPSGASKMITEPMVHSTQTMHQSCIDTNIVSKRPKLDLTWPTSSRGSNGCVHNDFPSLWYVQHKPCTYLVSRLALFPNGPKQAFTWASWPRRIIGCVQNYFYVWRKLCTYLAPTLTPSLYRPKRDLAWPT